jgi:hypothetical protein
MADRRARAKAHAKRAYFCVCGKLVHGNGGKAMHFYVDGQLDKGLRPGHGRISQERYAELHGNWRDHLLNGGKGDE